MGTLCSCRGDGGARQRFMLEQTVDGKANSMSSDASLPPLNHAVSDEP